MTTTTPAISASGVGARPARNESRVVIKPPLMIRLTEVRTQCVELSDQGDRMSSAPSRWTASPDCLKASILRMPRVTGPDGTYGQSRPHRRLFNDTQRDRESLRRGAAYN